MPIYKAPQNIENRETSLKDVFLAGSIEMDKAIDWQTKCEMGLTDNFNVFNPRRESWDSSWKQEIGNLNFKEQVNWELDALEQADHIIMFFDGNTKSPISLLEFGLHAKSIKLLVVCENHFWRKGNIDVICEKYNIQQFQNLNQVLGYLKNEL
jgi:hypothetical protein